MAQTIVKFYDPFSSPDDLTAKVEQAYHDLVLLVLGDKTLPPKLSNNYQLALDTSLFFAEQWNKYWQVGKLGTAVISCREVLDLCEGRITLAEMAVYCAVQVLDKITFKDEDNEGVDVARYAYGEAPCRGIHPDKVDEARDCLAELISKGYLTKSPDGGRLILTRRPVSLEDERIAFKTFQFCSNAQQTNQIVSEEVSGG